MVAMALSADGSDSFMDGKLKLDVEAAPPRLVPNRPHGEFLLSSRRRWVDCQLGDVAILVDTGSSIPPGAERDRHG